MDYFRQPNWKAFKSDSKGVLENTLNESTLEDVQKEFKRLVINSRYYSLLL